MKKLFQRFSVLLAILILISITTAFAESEKRFEITKKSYVTISNVTSEEATNDYMTYKANSPVKVTFYGNDLFREDLNYDKTGTEDNVTPFKFDVQKYTLPYSDNPTKVYDEVTQKPEDLPQYVSGNYATLTVPGFYYIYAGPEAEMPKTIIIEVTAKSTPVVTNPAPATATAAPTSSKVLVNGKTVSFEAYTINGNNYFKLRDIAMALNGTKKNFEVGWDGAKNAINLQAGKAYTPAGGELAISGNKASKKANLTTSKIYLDGEEVSLTAYNIGGSNYFKLRDIGKVFDFGVAWDGSKNTIGIDTSVSYTE